MAGLKDNAARDTDRELISKILKKRAAELAATDETGSISQETNNFLKIQLGQESYAIPTSHLSELVKFDYITEIPCTPDYISGVINLRGKIISIIDLKKLLGLRYSDFTGSSTIVIALHDSRTLGFLVDSVLGTEDISKEFIQYNIDQLDDIVGKFVLGICHDSTIILDVPSIIGDKTILVKDNVTS